MIDAQISSQRGGWRESTDSARLMEVVAWLKLLVQTAYYFSADDLASDAHDDLIIAEWRLRQSQRKLT